MDSFSSSFKFSGITQCHMTLYGFQANHMNQIWSGNTRCQWIPVYTTIIWLCAYCCVTALYGCIFECVPRLAVWSFALPFLYTTKEGCYLYKLSSYHYWPAVNGDFLHNLSSRQVSFQCMNIKQVSNQANKIPNRPNHLLIPVKGVSTWNVQNKQQSKVTKYNSATEPCILCPFTGP